MPRDPAKEKQKRSSRVARIKLKFNQEDPTDQYSALQRRLADYPPDKLVTDFVKTTMPGNGATEQSYKSFATINSDSAQPRKVVRKIPGVHSNAGFLIKDYLDSGEDHNNFGSIYIGNTARSDEALASQTAARGVPLTKEQQAFLKERTKAPDGQNKKAHLSVEVNMQKAFEEYYDAHILSLLFDAEGKTPEQKRAPEAFMTLSDYNANRYQDKRNKLKLATATEKLPHLTGSGRGIGFNQERLATDIVINALIGNLDTHNANYLVSGDGETLQWIDASDPNKRKTDNLLNLFLPTNLPKVTKLGEVNGLYEFGSAVGVQNYDDLNGRFINVGDFKRAWVEVSGNTVDNLANFDIRNNPALKKIINEALIFGGPEAAANLECRLEEMRFIATKLAEKRTPDETPMMQVAMSVLGVTPVDTATTEDFNIEAAGCHPMVHEAKEFQNIDNLTDGNSGFLVDNGRALHYKYSYDDGSPHDSYDGNRIYGEKLRQFTQEEADRTAAKTEALRLAKSLLDDSSITKTDKKLGAIDGKIVTISVSGAMGEMKTKKYFIALNAREITAGQNPPVTTPLRDQTQDSAYNVFEINDSETKCEAIFDYRVFNRACTRTIRVQEQSAPAKEKSHTVMPGSKSANNPIANPAASLRVPGALGAAKPEPAAAIAAIAANSERAKKIYSDFIRNELYLYTRCSLTNESFYFGRVEDQYGVKKAGDNFHFGRFDSFGNFQQDDTQIRRIEQSISEAKTTQAKGRELYASLLRQKKDLTDINSIKFESNDPSRTPQNGYISFTLPPENSNSHSGYSQRNVVLLDNGFIQYGETPSVILPSEYNKRCNTLELDIHHGKYCTSITEYVESCKEEKKKKEEPLQVLRSKKEPIAKPATTPPAAKVEGGPQQPALIRAYTPQEVDIEALRNEAPADIRADLKLYRPSNVLPGSGDRFDFSTSNANIKARLDSSGPQNNAKDYFNNEIANFLKSAAEISDLTKEDAAIILIIAIKNGGIGNEKAKLQADLRSIRITDTAAMEEFISKANKFSLSFQQKCFKASLFTGNAAPENFVGMRLKRINIDDVPDIFNKMFKETGEFGKKKCNEIFGTFRIKDDLRGPAPSPNNPIAISLNETVFRLL